jgi:drug/metabolite transporter (DMT)-like permease
VCETAAVLGILLGLGSAVAFGANSIITRRGMLRVSSNYVATISIVTGFLFFILVTLMTGDLHGIARLHWKAYLFWALSGIIHFALGRTWAYRSLQLLGSNRSNIVTSLSPIATVALAMFLLKETVTFLQFLGIIFTLSGPILILLKEQTFSEGSPMMSGPPGKEVDPRTLLLGVLYGAGAALFWGSSAIFIKFGLEAGGSPVAGTLIAYAAASFVISPPFLFSAGQRREIAREGIKPLPVAIFSGLTTSIAQLLRYLSFGFGSVIVVSLMLRTLPLWVLLFSFIFNRQYESFSRWVLIGNGLLMIGTILVISS